jgi:hypothetical protein
MRRAPPRIEHRIALARLAEPLRRHAKRRRQIPHGLALQQPLQASRLRRRIDARLCPT